MIKGLLKYVPGLSALLPYLIGAVGAALIGLTVALIWQTNRLADARDALAAESADLEQCQGANDGLAESLRRMRAEKQRVIDEAAEQDRINAEIVERRREESEAYERNISELQRQLQDAPATECSRHPVRPEFERLWNEADR